MTDSEGLVADPQALASLVDALADEPVIALDTEFVREQTYYPRLCLIQVAAPTRLACIDCLADLDLDALFAVLLAPGRTWLLHSARQDIEALQPFLADPPAGMPARLIDTQIAAALLGETPQIALQDLVAGELDIRLGKEFTRTDWAARPLPEGALQYALDDVRHLFALWRALRTKLDRLDRLAWLEEDCRTALATPVLTPPDALWSRLPRVRTLNARRRCAALALVEWRERCAQRLNRPRRWILDDALLVRIARAMPDRERQLLGLAEMPRRLARRRGSEILAAVAASKTAANLRRTAALQPPVANDTLRELRDRVHRLAGKLDIHPQVLATRQELVDLLRGTPSGRLVDGWRRNELQRLP